MTTLGAFVLYAILSLHFAIIFEIVLLSYLVALIHSSKLIVDWYFHTYIITSRKIIEVSYKPFFNAVINDVLLDQVRCTEVVVQTRGILDHLIDRGDIAICFDMPTHQDQFHFADIAQPHETGVMLGELLNTAKSSSSGYMQPIWYRRNTNLNPHQLHAPAANNTGVRVING